MVGGKNADPEGVPGCAAGVTGCWVGSVSVGGVCVGGVRGAPTQIWHLFSSFPTDMKATPTWSIRAEFVARILP